MARLPRLDSAGAWFHVMNRGIARRVVFPDVVHVRAFLAALAWEVRRGHLEVHAYCIMATHFHLLVRSPTGCLSKALGRALNGYVRWANRRGRRDGALFRGRFRSRPVLSLRYREVLVRYIEANPATARIVRAGEIYPHSSRAAQARSRRPRWLSVGWVDEVLERARRLDPALTYDSLWCTGISPTEQALVRERVRRPATTVDDLDELVGSAPPAVRAWMERKARMADGRAARPTMVDPVTVLAVVGEARARLGSWDGVATRGPVADLWGPAACGLLHALAGETLRSCSARLGIAPSRAATHLARHRVEIADPIYAARLAEIAASCLQRAHGRTGAGGGGDSKALEQGVLGMRSRLAPGGRVVRMEGIP